MDYSTIAALANELFSKASFIAEIQNEDDYQNTLQLMDKLVDNYDDQKSLIEVLSWSIARWEDASSEFREFNQQRSGLYPESSADFHANP